MEIESMFRSEAQSLDRPSLSEISNYFDSSRFPERTPNHTISFP